MDGSRIPRGQFIRVIKKTEFRLGLSDVRLLLSIKNEQAYPSSVGNQGKAFQAVSPAYQQPVGMVPRNNVVLNETADAGVINLVRTPPACQGSVEKEVDTRFRCPVCGGHDLFPTSDTRFSTTTSGGGYSIGQGCCGYLLLGPIGLLCGGIGSRQTTTTKSSSEHYWNCRECGNRFRDPDDLKEEAQKLMKRKGNLIILSVFFCVLAVIMACVDFASPEGELWWATTIFAITAVCEFVSSCTVAKKIENLMRQYEELNRLTNKQ